jgi:FkbM family methyltransferase
LQRLLWERIGREPGVIFDVGAHTGGTARAYRRVFPGARIHSFEPYPPSCAGYRDRTAGDGNVVLVERAVADRVGEATFYVNHFEATNSLLPRPSGGKRYYPSHAGAKTAITVPVTTLDVYAAEAGIGAVDILKIDIQGGELAALRGAGETLAARGVRMVYLEIMFVELYAGAPLFHRTWSHLVEAGYSLYDVFDLQRARNGQLRYGDALFIDRATREQVVDALGDEP